MPRNIVLLSDGSTVIAEILAPEYHCIETTWDRFTAEFAKSDDLLILAGSADQVRRVEWLAQINRGNCKVLVVLPHESQRRDIEFVLPIADEVTFSSESGELLRVRVRRLLDSCRSDTDAAYASLISELGRANLVGKDANFLRAAARMSASARSDLPVLITGETGTGKELFASATHFLSPRRNRPFVPVDCGGIPDHLFENELFGHARGAYTDAHAEQRGLISVAEGGTLFLDEIDSLPMASQAKLLRFLQERQFKALGSERWIRADVRIVAATNRDLTQRIADKEFRQDLYFRLDVLRLEIPPLRERPLDIPLLARHFLALHQPAGNPKSFSAAALRKLTSHRWPGNVRELLNVIQRAIVFSPGPLIDAGDIALFETPAATQPGNFRSARTETIEAFEREYVQQLLARHQGNITQAAREAGKERRSFGRLVKKYGLRAVARAAGQI